jgi:hypothetical protein
VNALTQIKAFTATLASNASDDVKSSDLVRLIHLLGDAHQPLHATPAFTAADPGDNWRQRGDGDADQRRD